MGADLNEDGLALKTGQHYREKLCGLLSSFEAIGTLIAFDETLEAYCGTYETAQKKRSIDQYSPKLQANTLKVPVNE